MSLTYRKLAEQIAGMTDEQKDCNVTVFDAEQNEYFSVNDTLIVNGHWAVLDDGHPVLSLFQPPKAEPPKPDYNSWRK